MKKLWQKEYTLRAGDFDKFDRIMPSAVLDLFQDAAGQHAEDLGIGFASMISRGYLWVLTRVKFKIVSAPTRYQNVVVKTWPLAPNRLNYRREYCIEDQDGKRLIIGSSEWVIIDSKTRKFLSDPNLYPFSDGFYDDIMFEGKLGKIHDFENSGEPYIINAGFCELDVNGHVNNTKYANYILDAVNPQKDDIIDVFQIDYRKEVMQGTALNIYCIREDNIISAKGQNNDGNIMFACKIDLKQQN